MAGKGKTTAQFILDSKKVWGNRYTYTKAEYIRNCDNVTITCKIHGDFKQSPSSHLIGRGCQKCGIATRSLKISEKSLSKHSKLFLIKSKKIHGDRYNYSKVLYSGLYKEVEIICNIHGSFLQQPCVHLLGSGCQECGKINSSTKRSLTLKEFIQRASAYHGTRYDYSKVLYTGLYNKVNILCKIHGVFAQKASDHLSGNGCQKCGALCNHDSLRDTKESFILKAKAIHGDTYDYENLVYISGKKLL